MWRLQLGHEALAEAHNFVVALALGIEVGAAFAAAHHQRRQRILEDLLERQELQDAEIDGRMEAQAALVGPDGAVHLDTVTAIDLHVAVIVEPRHAEHDDAFGFHDAFENPSPTGIRDAFAERAAENPALPALLDGTRVRRGFSPSPGS